MKRQLATAALLLAACKQTGVDTALLGDSGSAGPKEEFKVSFGADPATIVPANAAVKLDQLKELAVDTALVQQFALPPEIKASQWFTLKLGAQQPLRFRLAVRAGDKLCLGDKVKLGGSVTLECATKPNE